MFGALVSGSSGPASSPGRGHGVALVKTLNYHSVGLHLGAQMGTGESNFVG